MQYFFCGFNEANSVPLEHFYISKRFGREHGKSPTFQFHTYTKKTKKIICLLNIWNLFLEFTGFDVEFSFYSFLCSVFLGDIWLGFLLIRKRKFLLRITRY